MAASIEQLTKSGVDIYPITKPECVIDDEGNQVIAVLKNILGDLTDLVTDHKSDVVSAINELADLAETTHFVISFTKTSAELKEIYDVCNTHIVLAKNIVFYNSNDDLYYRVNSYNMINGVLKLHVLMQGVDTVVNLSSNGTLSVDS